LGLFVHKGTPYRCWTLQIGFVSQDALPPIRNPKSAMGELALFVRPDLLLSRSPPEIGFVLHFTPQTSLNWLCFAGAHRMFHSP
jgi:hypothetical protein